MRGRGIMSVTRHFGLSSSPTTEPTGYDPTPTPPTNTSRYLWAYDRITYDDGTTVDTKHSVAGVYGGDGQDGKTSYIHIAYANSADGVKDFSTSISAGKLYVGMYVDFNASASGNPGSYKWQAVGGADIRHEVDKLVSRGDQLVVNGNASMGDNTNFPGLTYDGKERCGGSASFTRPFGSGYLDFITEEPIPVDVDAEYEFSFDAKSLAKKAAMSSFLAFYDIDGNLIKINHVAFVPGTTTELAKELKNGDTVVSLKNVTEIWEKQVQSYKFGFIFWNYKDSRGYQYPVETYSRNVFKNLFAGPSAVNVEDNTITLSSPWTGGTIAKGTPLSQKSYDSAFSYAGVVYNTIPTEWTHYQARYKGLGNGDSLLKANIHHGAAFMRPGFVWTHNHISDDQVWVANISVRKVNKGDKGDPGEAAYTVLCSPSAAVFNTDENGNLLADAIVIVKVKQGTKDVDVNGKVSVTGATNFTKGEARVNGATVTLAKAGVAKQSVSAGGTTTTLPCTSGSVELQIAVDANTKLTSTIPFSVNVTRFLAETKSDMKRFERTFTEFKGAETSMSAFKSNILQSAREISREVSEQAVGAQNLLKDSELKTLNSVSIRWPQRNVCAVRNKGYNGTNALRVNFAGLTGSDSNYNGLFWDKEHVIKVERGGTYTFSFFAMSPAPSKVEGVWNEIYFWDGPNGSRQSQLTSMNIHEKLTTAYKLFTQTFTIPNSAQHEYIEIALFSLRNGEVYFSRPCLTKTDGYVGWSRSREDGERIGGNIMRGTRKFDGDFSINGTLTENGNGEFSTLSLAGVLYCNLPTKVIEANKDYMLSFWVKSSGDLTARLRNPNSDATPTCVLTENSDGVFATDAAAQRGNSTIAKKEAFTRVWMHFRTNANVADNMQVVFSKASATMGVICGLKLEKGVEVTEWTDDANTVSSSLSDIKTLTKQTSREIEFAITNGLKKIGININGNDDSVVVKAGVFKVETPNGTVSLIAQDGKIFVDLIDARKIVAEGVKSQIIDALNATFRNLNVQDGKFSGKLDGVEGSFKRLTCVDNDGKVVGEISFDSSGRIWLSGDFYHQGTKDGRGLRFYASGIWCRGSFGTAQRNTIVVNGSYAYYYVNGPGEPGVYVSLSSMTSSGGQKFYRLPCNGLGLFAPSGTEGFPADTVVFNISGTTTYYYELQMFDTQRCMVVNANDNYSDVYIYSNGNGVQWKGGEMAEVVRLPCEHMTPVPGNGVLGRGLLVGAFRDNDWK